MHVFAGPTSIKRRSYSLLVFSTEANVLYTLSVSADAPGCLRSGCVDSGLPTTTVALPGECLELRGRLGRRPDVAVCRSVRRVDGARCQCTITVLCWPFVVCQLRPVSCLPVCLALRQRAAADAAAIHRT